MARQATLALHQSRLAERSRRRRAAPGGARGAQPHRARHPRHAGAGLRRHPDAAAGGAALGAGRCRRPSAKTRDRRRPRPHAHDRGAPLGRRAAAATRATARTSAARSARMTDLARRTTDVPIELTIDELPRVRRRRRARDHRHRAGGADQRRAARARPPDHDSRVRACGRSASGCRSPTTAAASRREHARRRLRHDQHAGARRAHRRVADDRDRAARRHRSRARLGAAVVLDPGAAMHVTG